MPVEVAVRGNGFDPIKVFLALLAALFIIAMATSIEWRFRQCDWDGNCRNAGTFHVYKDGEDAWVCPKHLSDAKAAGWDTN